MALTVILAIIAALTAAGLVLWLIGERGHQMRPSTRSMLHAGGARNVLSRSALHAYIFARWPNRYVKFLLWGLGHSPKSGRECLSDVWHSKVLTHDHAEAIINLDHDIPLTDLEQIVPYKVARDIVLKGPPDVAVFECPCRNARANPCQPIQVCMAIGQPFVGFMLDHHPGTSRRLDQSEAMELLRQEHERGHMHTAWFKDAMLGRFYAICNCCKCCCVGLEAMVKYNAPSMTSSGYVAQVDKDICLACGTCVAVCPFTALSLDDGTATLDWGKCMGCEVCVSQCPNSAISLVRDERKGEPLDVRMLVAE
jgi:Pyruvate/2-oxoacid:ferredoxin oxidoreductase delta subunit